MCYKWLIFGVIFLLIPIGIANFKIFAEKKIKPTEEQKKNANLTFGLLILFYWLCDLFYMAIILDNLALKFIFGGLIMTIIFMNLSKAFIGGKPQLKWGLVQDFIVGVGMSVYLIYIIPNEALQNVVIPIVSAVYGGLITLVGVAWTIRKADSDRRNEEKKAFHPIIYPYKRGAVSSSKDVCNILFENKDAGNYHYLGVFKNTNNGILLVKELIVDGDSFPIKYGDVLEKEKIAQLILLTDQKLSFDEVVLIGTDVKYTPIKYLLTLNDAKDEIEKITEID